jgi:LacI family transcriptional regulator
LARETVNLMIGAIDRGAAGVPGQTILPFDIYLPESI